MPSLLAQPLRGGGGGWLERSLGEDCLQRQKDWLFRFPSYCTEEGVRPGADCSPPFKEAAWEGSQLRWPTGLGPLESRPGRVARVVVRAGEPCMARYLFLHLRDHPSFFLSFSN